MKRIIIILSLLVALLLVSCSTKPSNEPDSSINENIELLQSDEAVNESKKEDETELPSENINTPIIGIWRYSDSSIETFGIMGNDVAELFSNAIIEFTSDGMYIEIIGDDKGEYPYTFDGNTLTIIESSKDRVFLYEDNALYPIDSDKAYYVKVG